MIIIKLTNGSVIYSVDWGELISKIEDSEVRGAAKSCVWSGVNNHSGISGSGLVSLELAAYKEVERSKAMLSADLLIKRLMERIGDPLVLKVKSDIASRIISDSYTAADEEALRIEAEYRGETVREFALKIACKARWSEINQTDVSRRQVMVCDEIMNAANIDELHSIDVSALSDVEATLSEYRGRSDVAYAAAKMFLTDHEQVTEGWWTSAGKPSVDQLAARVGFEVSAALRDEVWLIESQF